MATSLNAGHVKAIYELDSRDYDKGLKKIKKDTQKAIKEMNKEIMKIPTAWNRATRDFLTSTNQMRTQMRGIQTTMRQTSTQFLNSSNSMRSSVSNMTTNMQRNATRINQSARQMGSSFNQLPSQIQGNLNRAQQHINRFTQQTNQAGQQIRQSTRVASGGSGGSNLAGAIGGIGAAAGTSYIVNVALDKDTALTQLENATGATEEEMKVLETSMDNIAEKGYGAFGEIGTSLNVVKRETGLIGEELEDTTKRAMVLSKTYGYDVKESVRAASSMTTHFGIDSKKAFDIMSRTAQVAGDSTDDLLDTFNEYAPQMKEMGLGAEDFANYLVIGAKSGVYNLDKVADVMKEMNLRIVGGGKPVEAAMQKIGLSYNTMLNKIKKGGPEAKAAYDQIIEGINNVQDEATKKSLIFDLTGAPGEDVGNNFFKGMAENKGKNLLGNVDGTTDKQMENYENSFQAQLESFMATVKTVLAPLGGEMLKSITGAIKMAEPFIKGLTKMFENPAFAKIVSTLILIATTVMAVVGPLGMLFGGFGRVAGIITKLLPIIRVVLSVISGPVGIIIGLLTLLYFAYKNNFLGIKDYIDKAIVWFKEFFANLIPNITNFINSAVNKFNELKDKIKGIFTGILDYIKGFGSKMFESGKAIINTLTDGIKAVLGNPKEALMGAFKELRNLLPFSDAKEGPLDSLTLNGRKIVSTIAEGINSGRDVLYDTMYNTLGNANDAISNNTSSNMAYKYGATENVDNSVSETNNNMSMVNHINASGRDEAHKIARIVEKHVKVLMRTYQK